MSATENQRQKIESEVESDDLDAARLGLVTKATPGWPGEFTEKLTQAGSHGAAKMEPTLIKGARDKIELENQKVMTQIKNEITR